MKYLTFGEIMLRLCALGHERLFQSNVVKTSFGGSEANVAVSLANYGENVGFLTVLPENAIGDACIGELRKFGVDTTRIIRGRGRMGIYFFEAGANQLPSNVFYDRSASSMALARSGDIEWGASLEDIGWLHISGITPALSKSAMVLSLEAVKEAKLRGITVSCDLNYQKKLWNYGKKADEVMREFTKYADIVVANEEDVQKAFGITKNANVRTGELDCREYRILSDKVLVAYPNVKMIAITLRESCGANRNNWSACLNDGNKFYVSKQYEINDIVDRIGSGDSFAAGLIYGLNHYTVPRQALEFAVASSCLKHSIDGDFNRVRVSDVEELIRGDVTGGVRR